MKVTKTMDGMFNMENMPRITNDEMQHEYDYLLAEQLTRKLLDSGLISMDEFNSIMEKNRKTFSPYFSKIFPE